MRHRDIVDETTLVVFGKSGVGSFFLWLNAFINNAQVKCSTLFIVQRWSHWNRIMGFYFQLFYLFGMFGDLGSVFILMLYLDEFCSIRWIFGVRVSGEKKGADKPNTGYVGVRITHFKVSEVVCKKHLPFKITLYLRGCIVKFKSFFSALPSEKFRDSVCTDKWRHGALPSTSQDCVFTPQPRELPCGTVLVQLYESGFIAAVFLFALWGNVYMFCRV